MTTPIEHAERERRTRQNTFTRRATDGPIVLFMKCLFGCNCWHCPIECFVRCLLSRTPAADQAQAPRLARAAFNRAIEWYWLLWLAILVVAYGMAFWAVRYGPVRGTTGIRFVAVFAAVLAVFRVCEILATSARLHFLEPYATTVPAHALSLTFLAFLQVAIAFAVLYLTAGYFCGDPFQECGDPLWSSWLSPIYFSIVTIATLGYGDFSPQTDAGKLLVIAECFVGLVLLVVAFQRVLSGIKTR